MSDPFGAIAMQRPGDLGIHIGNGQWASSQMQPGLPVVPQIGSGTHTNPSTAVTTPSKFSIVEGSAAHPVTSATQATMMITRYSNMSSGGDQNAALWVNHVSTSTTTQPVAIMGQTSGYTDNCPFYAVSKNLGTVGSAFGYFAFPIAVGVGSGAIGLQTNITNTTGASVAYTTAGGPRFVSHDAVYDAGGSGNYAGVANIIRSAAPGTDRWELGVWATGDSVRTATFQDDSAGVNSIVITGSHSDAGISITNNFGQYQQKWIRTSAIANSFGLAVLAGDGSLSIDEVGIATKFKILKGTPGANFTAVAIQEGAGPTLRNLKTFDPGAAGINFTAGQLVCVLV